MGKNLDIKALGLAGMTGMAVVTWVCVHGGAPWGAVYVSFLMGAFAKPMLALMLSTGE